MNDGGAREKGEGKKEKKRKKENRTRRKQRSKYRSNEKKLVQDRGGGKVVRGRFPCFSNAFYALNDRVIHKLLGEFLDICFRPFALENGRDGEEEEERKTRRYFSAVSNERSPTTRI